MKKTKWTACGVILSLLLAQTVVAAALTSAVPTASPEASLIEIDTPPYPTPRTLKTPWLRPDGEPLPFATDEEILEFLQTAEIVSSKRIGEGINKTRKVLLEKDGIRMNAAFRDVKTDQYLPDPNHPAFQRNHRDDCFFEVAAYQLSRMLGLRVVPPTVVRKIDGKQGSLQAWVEKAMMEKERRVAGLQPPDEWYWMSQMLVMHLFDNLVGNTDRHQGNLLIGKDWNIWLIDHTQAFRRFKEVHTPEKLLYCERTVWSNLQKLDKKQLKKSFKGLLRNPEIDALIERRDQIVDQINRLIEQHGEDKILFSIV